MDDMRRLLRERSDPATQDLGRVERMAKFQRGRILTAMAEVCAAHGAANVTVAQVVERAGVSRRTFYELFRDRETCFLAAFEEAIARATRYVLEDRDPTASWPARTRSGLTGLLRFIEQERGLGRLLVVDSLGAGARALARRAEVLARLVAAVDEGRAELGARAEPPALTAEGVVGGVLAILHSRLLALGPVAEESPLALRGQLMSLIVAPYLGSAAARRELARPAPAGAKPHVRAAPADPLRDLRMRLTYRTLRVLGAVAAHPGSSNRELGVAAGVDDQGQISRLLGRLSKLGLIENEGVGYPRGGPNAWVLTAKGVEIENAFETSAAG